jgi:hypothetical protein
MASIREDLEADDALRQCTALLQVRRKLPLNSWMLCLALQKH